MSIVYFGSDIFAERILSHLLEKKLPIAAVVTAVDRPKGRSQRVSATPVKEFLLAQNSQVQLLQPEKASSPEFVALLRQLKPELIVVVSYGQLLKQNLLDLPSLGIINVHPSLLPKYRGPSPIQSAVLAGEKETGVTIMEINLELDAGDIIDVQKVSVDQEETFGEVETKLAQVSCHLLEKNLRKILQEKKIQKTPQNHSQATFTKKIFPEDALISFDQPAWKVHNLVRGMNPRPGARCMIEIGGSKKVLKVLKSQVVAPEEEIQFDLAGLPSGEIVSYNKKEGVVVACQKSYLRLLTLQLEGKREMNFLDFINGFSSPIFA